MKNLFSKLCIAIFLLGLFTNCNGKLNTESACKNIIKTFSKGHTR